MLMMMTLYTNFYTPVCYTIGRLESAKEQTMDETLEMYRESLSKLLTKDSPTFHSLVEEYRDLWNQNITRFNYINELGNEVSKLVPYLKPFLHLISLHYSS